VERGQLWYFAVITICFLYGGYALLMFAFQIYFPVWRSEAFAPYWFGHALRDKNAIGGPDSNNAGPQIKLKQNRPFPSMIAIATSPYSLTLLGGGIVSILAAGTLWNLLRKKEISKVKRDIANHLLLPNEARVVNTLSNNSFELTQSAIAKKTGLTKVQVFRAVKSLEAKGLVSKHPFGLTNKIILSKEFREERG